MSKKNSVSTNTTSVATAPLTVVKEPSKKSQAQEIFKVKMAERRQGLFATNKEFRAAVLSTLQADLGVSTASAATMYNQCKKDSEAADNTVVLGRDPKKVKAPSTGVRGRPAKIKEQIPEVAVVVDEVIAGTVTA